MSSFEERMKEYKTRIPEEYHEAFEEVVSRGMSPQGAAACIYYIDSDMTQEEVSEKMGVSTVTIKRNIDVMRFALGEDLSITRVTVAEIIDRIAQLLDWEEGKEYSHNGSQSTFMADGYRKIYEKLKECED